MSNGGRTRARARRTSSSSARPGPRSAAPPRQPLTGEEIERVRGLGDAARPRRGAAGLPAAVAPAQPVRRGGRPSCTAAPRSFLHQRAAAAHPVRDRPGRLGGGRQVHDRARAPADAGALARAPPGRAGHHRRLPAAQRRAAPARAAAPQGVPGVLRPQGAAEVRHRHQVGQGRGRGTDVLPPRLRRGARREGRDHRPDIVIIEGLNVLQPARIREDGRTRSRGQRLLRLLGLRRRGHQRHPAVVHRPVPAAARDRVPRPRVVLRPLRLALPRRGGQPRPTGSGTRSTAPT